MAKKQLAIRYSQLAHCKIAINHRFLEIDLLRTLAVLLMIIFHTAYDLSTFYNWDIHLAGPVWQTLRIITASLFLIISGVSMQFSRTPFRRALKLLSCAVLITIVTYLYDPSTYIYFGILHCIGFGMLVLIPLQKYKKITIPLGIGIAMIPAMAPPHPTLDFYPPIPWIGLMFVGYGVGHYIYKRKQWELKIENCTLLTYFTFPGRHALLIYLVHQPIILVVLHMIFAN